MTGNTIASRNPSLRLLVATMLCLPLVAWGGGASAAGPYREVGVEEVEKMLGASDVRVYDVNNREMFEKHHLPGAVHVGRKKLESLLPADRTVRLVFYCTNPL